ncbi:MAG: alpha/beta hydrolase [Alphaproteobacteria bacterium]|nr:alpha/beta hydrolase [Alphaproteobacteria bacterium]
MHTVTLRDGAKLAVADEGVGSPPLVLVSGLGGTAGFWNPLIDAIGPEIRTIRFDQRGIGASERGRQPVTIETLAADTWQIIDQLAIPRPVLCGHSTGGAIVQEMELMRPGTTSGIVLSGSWAGPDLFMERMFGIRLELLAKLPARYSEFAALLGSPPAWHRDHPDALRNVIDQAPSEAEAAIIEERIHALLAHDCRGRLSRLRSPALILGAADDMIVPAYLQRELAALLANPALHMFDHGGHFYPVTRPADTAATLRRWLSTIDT